MRGSILYLSFSLVVYWTSGDRSLSRLTTHFVTHWDGDWRIGEIFEVCDLCFENILHVHKELIRGMQDCLSAQKVVVIEQMSSRVQSYSIVFRLI